MAWTQFRPAQADLQKIAGDVAAIPDIQQTFLARSSGLKVRDRVAHQYQIAGGRVSLRIASRLPASLAGVGLFVQDAEHVGLGRLSTGLGCPHRETDPDFLGLMLAFAMPGGQRIDLLAINHPAAPSPNQREFMTLLDAAADGAGAKLPSVSGLGKRNLPDLIAGDVRVTWGLIRRMGLVRGLRAALHVLVQTLRTSVSGTAYQIFWTGVVEAGGSAGKIMMVPATDENGWYRRAGERHRSEEWRRRQARAGALRARPPAG